MKERIKNLIIALLVFAGFIFVGSLMIIFMPLWLRCAIWGLMLIWLLWDVSKPESKKHYWLYHSIEKGEKEITIGVLENDKTTFSLSGHEFDIEKSLIFSAVEIDKETYDIINNTIKSNNTKL